ncbi:hypothetical protein LOTGIDRAFT_174963 [Lottia gigantea]|uniref:DNA-(apurinic or apyrimidinic site) lyase n=1 Tax=Lottia gigantea TaxID=225164 RepID=V4C3S9_LOTGI|nr:hypothetical protein LOTGIDRAFT_174963 [Lottia gigantea]ESO96204.1 hypothetical protein LOTGIDRAFT_174963 [Lottia gigantea]
MVEGPGCKLKGENIRAGLRNKILSKIIVRSPIQANGTKREELSVSEQKKQTDSNELVERKLDDVVTLGKELFMIFGDKCLRLHFLMNGSHRISESGNMVLTGKKIPPVLEVYFGPTVLFFYESSFDVSRPSCKWVQIIQERSIPRGLVKNQLCRKTGSPLNKHYKIYSLAQCKSCGTRVTKTKMGDDSSRVTYFCHICQTEDVTKLDNLTLPSKNSLLNWVQSSNAKIETQESNWSCQTCTLLNSANRITCEVCGGPKSNQSKTSSQNSEIIQLTDNRENLFTFVKETKLLETSLNSCTNISKPNPFALMDTTGKNFQNDISHDLKSSKSISKPKISEIVVKSRKRTSSEFHDTQNDNKRARTNQSELDQSDTNWKFPNCSGHKQKCGLWQTHKPGPNNRRWFFTCALKGKQKCNHFEWADIYFPCCPGHNKTCSINTVLKVGANNGRKFFSCAQSRKEQCQFFEWAEGFGGVAVAR